MVELKNVSVTYSTGVDALNNISLRIEDGDFAFVVGSSGAGKSTLIKLILKEIDATSGIVMVNDYNLSKLRKKRIPEFRRTIGFVFQDFRLIPSMTVYENIAFVLRVIDAPRKYIRKRVPYVISLVGLQDKANSYPNQLSGGMQQRVGIARAFGIRPEILLMDEPFSALDEFTKEKLHLDLLNIWEKTNKTIVFVTHNIQEAVFLSTRICVLSPHPGRLSAVVDADLPYPRTIDMRDTPHFGELVSKVRNSFEGV